MNKLKANLVKAQTNYLKANKRLDDSHKLFWAYCRKVLIKLLRKQGFKGWVGSSNLCFRGGIKARGWDINKEGFDASGAIDSEKEFTEVAIKVAPEFYKITEVMLRISAPDEFDPMGFRRSYFLLPKEERQLTKFMKVVKWDQLEDVNDGRQTGR